MIRKNALVVLMAGAVCFGQASTKPSASTTAAKTSKAAAPAKPAVKPAIKAAPMKSAAMKPAKVMAPATAMAARKTAKHKAAQPVTAAAAPAPASEASATGAGAAKKRDPFVNPIQAVREGRSGSCSGGKRCLAVNEIVLRGVVKSVGGMIAVVENSAQRTYFLRENDAIYNGSVQKITPDSVVFREHYIDNLGKDEVREVVKTVNAPAV